MAFGSVFADADVGSGEFNTTATADFGFGPASSSGGGRHPLYPDNGFAWSFWLGVGGLAVLVLLRRSLPA